MVMPVARPVATLVRRGPGLVIPLTEAWVKRLGWNRNDQLHLELIDGMLVVTKIQLPTAALLRTKVNTSEKK